MKEVFRHLDNKRIMSSGIIRTEWEDNIERKQKKSRELREKIEKYGPGYSSRRYSGAHKSYAVMT